jgi:hypothetical protein
VEFATEALRLAEAFFFLLPETIRFDWANFQSFDSPELDPTQLAVLYNQTINCLTDWLGTRRCFPSRQFTAY